MDGTEEEVVRRSNGLNPFQDSSSEDSLSLLSPSPVGKADGVVRVLRWLRRWEGEVHCGSVVGAD